jgi:hypothetical protein
VLSYTLRIDTLNNNQKLVGLAIDTKNPTKDVKLEIGKIYYWYIITNDGAISVKSDTYSFKIK